MLRMITPVVWWFQKLEIYFNISPRCRRSFIPHHLTWWLRVPLMAIDQKPERYWTMFRNTVCCVLAKSRLSAPITSSYKRIPPSSEASGRPKCQHFGRIILNEFLESLQLTFKRIPHGESRTDINTVEFRYLEPSIFRNSNNLIVVPLP